MLRCLERLELQRLRDSRLDVLHRGRRDRLAYRGDPPEARAFIDAHEREARPPRARIARAHLQRVAALLAPAADTHRGAREADLPLGSQDRQRERAALPVGAHATHGVVELVMDARLAVDADDDVAVLEHAVDALLLVGGGGALVERRHHVRVVHCTAERVGSPQVDLRGLLLEVLEPAAVDKKVAHVPAACEAGLFHEPALVPDPRSSNR
mmetsp:Transcript_94947/g.284565  ORF Transcript_94947/g.284565 Transcript_94947/m.284565 type:complete len:211 (+) Transcript_94947:252-884(+)